MYGMQACCWAAGCVLRASLTLRALQVSERTWQHLSSTMGATKQHRTRRTRRVGKATLLGQLISYLSVGNESLSVTPVELYRSIHACTSGKWEDMFGDNYKGGWTRANEDRIRGLRNSLYKRGDLCRSARGVWAPACFHLQKRNE